jgi:hypothetical protein
VSGRWNARPGARVLPLGEGGMGRYLNIIRQARSCAESAESVGQAPAHPDLPRLSGLLRTLAALESGCPDLIPVNDWQLAVDDGRRSLARWGEQAEALGWSYSRLSRYDEPGLIWLLRGRPVVALTEETAAIQSSTGTVTVYRRHNQPPLRRVPDSLTISNDP